MYYNIGIVEQDGENWGCLYVNCWKAVFDLAICDVEEYRRRIRCSLSRPEVVNPYGEGIYYDYNSKYKEILFALGINKEVYSTSEYVNMLLRCDRDLFNSVEESGVYVLPILIKRKSLVVLLSSMNNRNALERCISCLRVKKTLLNEYSMVVVKTERVRSGLTGIVYNDGVIDFSTIRKRYGSRYCSIGSLEGTE